jgi:hypothetical protein
MDTLTPALRRETLHQQVGAAQFALTQAAAAAALQSDPLAEQLKAFSASIGALANLYDASEDTQFDIAEKLATLSDAVTKEAISRVHASGANLVETLAPRLANLVEDTAKSRRIALWLRAVSIGAASLIAAVAVAGGVAYYTGFTSGKAQGEIVAQTISQAFALGPEAAKNWSILMRANDPTKALTACKKSIQADDHGRRFCSMPVWLDPPPAPGA